MAIADQWTIWRPMQTAPNKPMHEVATRDGIAWVDAYRPDAPLLCWSHDQPLLIRAAWHTRDGKKGNWRELKLHEPVDVRILAWAPLPSGEKLAAMVVPDDN